MEKIIHTIALTGGPCSGKTTGLAKLEMVLKSLNYRVLIIPETATELILNGIKPNDGLSVFEFQMAVVNKQLFKEDLYESIALTLPENEIVILCDRGVCDTRAFLTEFEYSRLLSELAAKDVEIKSFYDAVIHLVTTAKGAEEFYTLSNNKARTETLLEAAKNDDEIIKAWTGHPNFKIIDNSKGLEAKMDELISSVLYIVGKPIPKKVQYKFLVENKYIPFIKQNCSATEINIEQTYLESGDDTLEIRVRKFGESGNYVYYYTEKREVDKKTKIEVEKKISEEEYNRLAKSGKFSLKKVRYYFVHNNQYFWLDVFTFSEDKAILEIKLTEENERLIIPKFIKVIKDVSEDKEYSNYEIAKRKSL